MNDNKFNTPEQSSGIVSKKWMVGFLYLAALEGLIAMLFLAFPPSEPQDRFALGLSLARFSLLLFTLMIAAGFAGLGLLVNRQPGWIKRIDRIVNLKQLGGVLSWGVAMFTMGLGVFIFLTPPYQLGSLFGYLMRARPILIWVDGIGLQTLVILVASQKHFLNILKGEIKVPRSLLLATCFTLFSMALIWFVMAKTGLGLKPDDRYWNVAGVPLLNSQIFISIVLVTGGIVMIELFKHKWSGLSRRLKLTPSKVDFLIFIFLWVCTALMWVHQPLPSTFFTPGPNPPTYEYYPYADAALYDIGGQYALIGQGIYNHQFFDRSLLMGFLAIIHLIVGQNYLKVIGIQTLVFAVFPSLLYLLGKAIHNRVSGVLIALLAIFKELNAITVSPLIDTANPKLMLTEFPTAIIVVLFSLALFNWMNRPKERIFHAVLAGGTLGLGIMLRTNILLLFPVAIGASLFVSGQSWKEWLQAISIMVLAFFITISPWMWRNDRVANIPMFFLPRFQGVLSDRYSSRLPNSGISVLPASDSRWNTANTPMEGMAFAGFNSSSALKADSVRGKAVNTNWVAQDIRAEESLVLDSIKSLYFIPNHFFHNLGSSVLTLPTSPVFHDLRHTIKIYPYWNKVNGQWEGELEWPSGFFLTINLAIISLGLGTSWRKWKFAGLVPLGSFLAYNLSNGLARTSGGRYIIPAEWVVYFYFGIGLVQIILAGLYILGFDYQGIAPTIKKIQGRGLYKPVMFALIPFFLIVLTLPLIEIAIPRRYVPQTKEQLLNVLVKGGSSSQTNISPEALTEFLKQPSAVILEGRALYPRYLGIGQGEHTAFRDVFSAKSYPGFAFALIGPNMPSQFLSSDISIHILLPQSNIPRSFLNASDVIVVGCGMNADADMLPYVDALLVADLGDPNSFYVRDPESPLLCPLRQPVCDNNHVCR